MNIFEYHLAEIKKLISLNKKNLKLNNIDNLKSVNLEVPPEQFNFDLSCNIAMVLGKENKLNPKELAVRLKNMFLDEISSFSKIEIAGPGFLNINLSKTALLNNINSIMENGKIYGSTKNNSTYNIVMITEIKFQIL